MIPITDIDEFSNLCQKIFDRLGKKNLAEPVIVKRFTQIIAHLAKRGLFPRWKVNAVFIHQNPYAMFRAVDKTGKISNYQICGKSKVELGDILFVVKRISGREVADFRGSFAQVKCENSGRVIIEPHQLEFLSNISSYTFEFGRAAYRKSGYMPILWGIGQRKWFSQYLIISSRNALSIETQRIKKISPGVCSKFSFPFHGLVCTKGMPHCVTHDGVSSFLKNFLKPNGVGFKVRGRLFKLVDVIFKKLNLVIDPPEEHEGYFEDGRGFSVIQIQIEDSND